MDNPVQDHYSHFKDSVRNGCLQQTNVEHVTKDSTVVRDTKVNQNNHMTKTVNVFQQSQLLDCTLQTAKLIKENAKLQEKINELQRKVDEASQKTKADLHRQFVKLQKLSKAIGSRPKLTAVRTRLNPSVRRKAIGARVKSVNTLGVSNTRATNISLTSKAIKNPLEMRPVLNVARDTTVGSGANTLTAKPDLNT